MDIKVDPHSSIFPESLDPYVGAILVETFLFGLYTTLFVICVYYLFRQRRSLHWIFPVFAVALYSVAAADMLYTVVMCFRRFLKGTFSYQDLRPKYFLHVTNNILADSLLLYRCYIIWNQRKRIVIVPALLLIGSSIVGYLLEGSTSTMLLSQSWIYLVLTLVLNVVLNVLTAGRIWWVSRSAKNLLDPGSLRRYNFIINTIIESGIIYSVYMIIDVILHNDKTGSIIIDAGLIQIVGIMPTLIIVQISIGRAVDDVEATRGISPFKASPIGSRKNYQAQSENSTSIPNMAQTFTSSDAPLITDKEGVV